MGLWQGAHFYWIGEGGEVLGDRSTLPPKQGIRIAHSQKDGVMIIFVRAHLKEIFDQERKYAWPRPERCPLCGMCKVWGHGFVLAYFDGIGGGVYLRRYRCPECRCVLRLRPIGFFARIQASIETIRESLWQRLHKGRWPRGSSGSRRRHWLKALTRNAVAFLGNAWNNALMEAFDRLISLGVIPVSRAIKGATGIVLEPPYRGVR